MKASALRVFKRHGFVLAIGLAMAMAWVTRDAPSRVQETLSALTPLAIFTLFLLQGLMLRTDQLRAGARNGRHHAFVLCWNFLGFPLVVAAAAAVLAPWGGLGFGAGFAFLAVLPTTISSAVGMTAAARGDVAAAVFSTVLSNLAGVVLVPTLALLWYSAQGTPVDPGQMLGKLALVVVLPLTAGQILRCIRKLGTYVSARAGSLRLLSNGLITLIVLASFQRGFSSDAWSGLDAAEVLAAAAVVVAVLLVVMLGTHWTARGVGLTGPLRPSAFYCATQKTLAIGVPLAHSLHLASPTAVPEPSLLLVPLMLYHPLQLFVGSALSPHLSPPPDPARRCQHA